MWSDGRIEIDRMEERMYNPNISSERANNSTNTRREDMKQVVHAPCGPVMGVRNKGVYQFHGIPYAQPPVGPLRFQKPRRMERWEETYDGTADCVGSGYPHGTDGRRAQ